jgi:signal transduction histidine kinase
MRRLLFGTTARQVAWVVALATVSSNLLVVVAWLMLSPGSLIPGSVRALAAEAVALVEVARAVPAAADAARPGGIDITEAPAVAPSGARDAVIARALADRLAERGVAAMVSVVAPSGSSRAGIIATVQFGDGRALQVTIAEARMRDAIPTILLPPTTVVLLLGVPLLLVLLWVASMVTRPMGQLAQAANAIAATGRTVALPEAGAREIRDVARAINGLLDRLRQDVAERSRILAGISHDLRTPLTRMTLRAETVPDATLRQQMTGDLGRMQAIVGASLALLEADLREEPAEVIDLAALAAKVCDEFADAGHDASYHGPLHLIVRAQPIALERAIGNLVDNACRHAGQAFVTVAEQPGQVSVTVEDDGPGIAETDLPHVTDSYRRRNGEAGQSGLGLAIVASVARAHGGRLTLGNRLPRGVVATLVLPALDGR